MGLLRKIHQRHETPRPHRESFKKSLLKRLTRLCRFEQMEKRQMLSVCPPIQVGTVYLEDSDRYDAASGDVFEVTFNGGAPGTQLTELRINTDKDGDGLTNGDVFFDTAAGGLGVYGSSPFRVVSQNGIQLDSVNVVDGGTEIVLRFTGFDAGEKFVFSIDVDEQGHSSANAVAEGGEFEDSILSATFTAPHYLAANGSDLFKDAYDSKLQGSGLDLPSDNYNPPSTFMPVGAEAGPVYTAGAIFSVQQTPKPITLSGNVYYDRNANNLRESGDQGLGGVSLSLWELIDGQYVDTGRKAVTDSTGYYEFKNVLPGTYRLQEEQPKDYISVGNTVGTVSGQPRGVSTSVDVLSQITLEGGDDSIHNDFAETLYASLSGHVYFDANNNGIRDAGEIGIGGVTLRLINAQGNPLPFTVVTDASGFYQFSTLMPGTYGVAEMQPNGYLDGKDQAGTAGGTALNPGDRIDGAVLLGGQKGENYDFGELLPCSLAGRVFLDMNGNAAYDSGDTLLVGVTIRLLDTTGTELKRTVTDSSGNYLFSGLTPGSYAVAESQPDGYLQGDSLIGSVGGTRVSEDLMKSIAIPSGVDAVRYDFYEVPPASLSGFVYADDNRNGLFDNGEKGIGGTTLTLLDANGKSTGLTTVTDSTGYYVFTNLRPGTYGVAETQPTDYQDGLDTAGTAGGTAHNPGDLIDAIALVGGMKAKNYNFGEIRPASIRGRVFVDLNGNNAYDVGETYLPGVTMYLVDASGIRVGSTQTDAQGNYAFVNLTPGQYAVEETQPAGYLQGSNQVGSAGGALDGPDRITDIFLGSGVDAVRYDFWEVIPAKLSGFVFQDGPTIRVKKGEAVPEIPTIRDGKLTPDDLRLAGIVIRLCDGFGNPLYDAGGNPITTVTDANGYYEFSMLKPGSYSVVEVQPTGYVQGVDTAGSLGGEVVNEYTPIQSDMVGVLVVDPMGSSIVRIELMSGEDGTQYNFSEVKVEEVPDNPPMNPDPIPDPPPLPRTFPFGEPIYYHPSSPMQIIMTPTIGGGTGGPGGMTWHLSIINGGQPRSTQDGNQFNDYPAAKIFDPATWRGEDVNQGGEWIIADRNGIAVKKIRYGLQAAIPVVGDWNGDGISDLGVFLDGHWFLDLDGNRKWGDDDFWAKLGEEGDQPVAGDWDGDGKSDIGIFGQAWVGDVKAVEADPGLPTPLNQPKNTFKNVPPDPLAAAVGHRTMKRTHAGTIRSDLIDHVFEYGTKGDRAVVGDWNGDGIRKIGVFRKGTWYLDVDGDGRWSDADQMVSFGQEGDLPVAGDWTGDGVTKLGVYRNGTFYLDTNNNHTLDATDKVFELGTAGDMPVAGDFNGSGVDTVGVYHQAPPETVQ